MITATKDALRRALREVFPLSDVPQLHESNIPVGFIRPALFIQMMPWGPRHIASGIHEFRVRWQVVYFPREDAVGNAMQGDLFRAIDLLEQKLGRALYLTSPTGEILHVTDFTAEERDDVVYASLTLSGCLRREEPPATLLGEAELTMKEE